MTQAVTELSRLMVCVDCLFAIAYDDYSGITDERKLLRVEEAVQNSAGYEGYLVPCGDEDTDEEFSSRTCECCGDIYAGSRHLVVVLSN